LGGYEAVVNWDWLRAGSPETRETPAPRGACPSFSTGANEAVAVGAPCGEGAVLLRGLGEIGTVPDASGSAQIKAVIWDTTAEEMSHPDAVEGLRALAGHAPIVALVNFPRPDDCRRAMAAGVAAVIAKPFSIHDLLWQIARVVAGPPSTKSQNGVGS
jgi:CheY-like chemotaxis protein